MKETGTMKHMTKTASLLMALLLSVSSLAGCATSGKGIMIGDQDAGRTISLKTGETLIIELDGNVTTGFNWHAAPQGPALLEQIGEPVAKAEGSQPGAPGKVVLKFEAIRTGQTNLRLDYKRAWETDVAPAKTFEVTVVVE